MVHGEVDEGADAGGEEALAGRCGRRLIGLLRNVTTEEKGRDQGVSPCGESEVEVARAAGLRG